MYIKGENWRGRERKHLTLTKRKQIEKRGKDRRKYNGIRSREGKDEKEREAQNSAVLSARACGRNIRKCRFRFGLLKIRDRRLIDPRSRS